MRMTESLDNDRANVPFTVEVIGSCVLVQCQVLPLCLCSEYRLSLWSPVTPTVVRFW